MSKLIYNTGYAVSKLKEKVLTSVSGEVVLDLEMPTFTALGNVELTFF